MISHDLQSSARLGIKMKTNTGQVYDRMLKSIYNANIQNNREIDRVHNYELYIATVSIKHKSVDRIKTALRFWLNATR